MLNLIGVIKEVHESMEYWLIGGPAREYLQLQNLSQQVVQFRVRVYLLTSTTVFYSVFVINEMEQALECIQKHPKELKRNQRDTH